MKKSLKHVEMKRLFTLVLFLVTTMPFLFAQEAIKISGTVLDENKEPLIGVSVLEKGTSNGTITDINGNYVLTVKLGSTVVYSYIGYETQEKSAVTEVISTILKEDAKTLDEVVVVGYGIQKKSSLTGAVSQVKAEDMETRTITRPEQALQGKTAGVQVYSASAKPGASPQVRIRGISSNGDSTPLYVVDGRIAPTSAALIPTISSRWRY